MRHAPWAELAHKQQILVAQKISLIKWGKVCMYGIVHVMILYIFIEIPLTW